MATIRRRGTTWQVQVRRQEHATLSRTFRLKADAEQWARQKEAEIDRGELASSRHTHAALQRDADLAAGHCLTVEDAGACA